MAGLFDDVPEASQQSGEGLFDDIPAVAPPKLPTKKATAGFIERLFSGAPTSVLEGVQFPPPPVGIDFRAANDRAMKPAAPGARAPSEARPSIPLDEGFLANAERIMRKAVGGIEQGKSGLVRMVGDVTGLDSVSEFARDWNRSATELSNRTQGGKTTIDGFTPGSIVQDLPAAAEGATVSIAQQLPALATGNLPAALAIMFGQSTGQQFNEVRDKGLDIAPAVLNAVLTGGAEVVGEKFGGTPGTIKALKGALAGNAPARVAADMARAGVRDLPSELGTTAMQYGTDAAPWMGTNKDPSLGELGGQLKDTALQTILQGGIMSGSGAALASAAQAAGAKPAPVETPAGPAPAEPAAPDATGQSRKSGVIDRWVAGRQAAGEIDRAAQNIADQPTPQVSQQIVASIFADLPDKAQQPATAEPANPGAQPAEPAQEVTPNQPQAIEQPAQPAAPVQRVPAAAESQNVQDPAPQPGPETQAAPAPAPQVAAAPIAGQSAPGPQAGADAVQAAGVSTPAFTQGAGAPPLVQETAKNIPQNIPSQRLGRNNTPLTEGGKPFKSKLQADTAKKQQPMLRVVKVDGGYALADKTPAQLAAQEKAARRLRNPQTSPAGQAIPAHAMIAAAGGLHPDTRADMGMEGNVTVGNRKLFAGKGKGLTIERATEKLIEDGYLPAGAGHDQARALIKRSLKEPQYTPEGTERMAQAEADVRFEDHLAAQQEAAAEDPDFDPFPAGEGWMAADIEDSGYQGATPEIQAEVRALIAMADAAGIDSESIKLDAHDATRNGTTQEYYEFAKSALEKAIAGSRGDSSPDAGQQGGTREQASAENTDAADANPDAPAEGLTSYTQSEVLDRLAKLEQAQKDKQTADAKAEADAKKESDRKDIASRQDASADNFQLGQSAEDSLSGQGSIFDEPAPAPEPSQQERRAKADLQNALADLGDIFSAKFKANMMTPQQEAKLVPVLTRVLDAAFRLGYVKFKDAAKFALEQIRTALGSEVADSLTLDHLQGSYIAMAGGRPGADTKRAVIDVEDMSEIEAHTAQNKEPENASDTNGRVERDSGEPAAEPAMGDPVQDDAGGSEQGPGRAGRQARRSDGSGQQDGSGLPADRAPATGEPGNQRVFGRDAQRDFADITTGAGFSERGADIGIEGIPPESIPAGQVEAVAQVSAAKPAQGSTGRVKPGDLADIRATLPQLLTGQQEDVKKAEDRFAKPTGYGMLFTNGTGTGKTFTGLGIAKRFALQGKTNILIATPDDKIAADWIESGKLLGLDITQLKDTKDAGKGIVITTYANLGENDALASREWDLVIPDEAHSLMQSADGKPTTYLHNLRAITHHPDGATTRHTMLSRADIDKSAELHAQITSNTRARAMSGTMDARREVLRVENVALEAEVKPLDAKIRAALAAVKEEVNAKQGAGRARLAALSATPFAYEKTIDWANGYLFDYKDGYPHNETSLAYNQPDPREYFFQTRLGYTMRVNKLTEPDGSKVDRGLMQRQFNGELKKNGVLSGRMLDVKPDYDRRFVLVNSAIGNRIDEALAWLNEQRHTAAKGDRGYSALADAIHAQFKYLQKRYLLEAIKATEVIPIVKAHMAKGRKVVVFHDYKKGGGFNPFQIPAGVAALDGGETEKERVAQFNQARAAFNEKFAALVNLPLADMDSPIEVFKRELPQTMLVNGDEKKSDLLKRYKSFQSDATGPQVMLVQSAKNKGWSGHDTTGKHQRVLINLGQPTAPTLAIQQEGRIYRTGQATDAIMRYLNTGTDWERMTFASVIASRASTSENLGMGEMARALKDSFIQSFEESDTYEPGHEGEGKGGKERDKAANDALTEYDRAKSHYWATQKKTSRNKAQEGTDYFATPEPVGLKMVQWLDSRPGEDTMEPSAGHGAIARWLPDTTKRTVIEPSMALRSRLALVMDANITRMVDGTFEEHAAVNKYDGIVMNPPFGTAGKTAVDHMAKAAQHLRDGGRLVALIPTGPAADAKFEKWFYETDEKPVKPLLTHPTLGEIYKGDKVTSRASWAGAGTVASMGSDGGYVMLKVEGKAGSIGVSPQSILTVEPTGKRSETYSPAANLTLVADIKMPQVTFERAGTAVATRIVVIEKHSDPADAPKGSARNLDLSRIDDIGDLFTRLEHIDLPTRTKARKLDDAPAWPFATSEPAATKAPAAPAAANAPAAPKAAPAELGDAVVIDGKPYEVTTYTTNAGKVLRGVWVPTKAQALTLGPSTFEKRGQGFFVRERDFPKAEAGKAVAESVDQLSRPEQAGTSTAATVRAALNSRFGKLIERMEGRGFLQVWDSAEQFNQSGQSSRHVEGVAQGLWDGKTAHLFADGIRQGDEVAVMLHEVGEHASMQKMLGPQQYNRLVARAHDLMYADDPIALAAVARIPENTPEKFRDSELLAYMIEIVASQEAKASPSARKWLADVMAAIRAWWSQTAMAEKLLDYGIRMELTPKDIAALAVRAVNWRGAQPVTEVDVQLSRPAPAASSWTAPAGSPPVNPATGALTPQPWNVAEPGTTDNFVRAIQNNKIDLKRVRDAITEQIGAIPAQADAYLNEELYHGKVSARVTALHEQQVEPILKKIAVAGKNAGITLDDVNQYLHARHAPERNAAMQAINPGMANNTALSGMSDAEAGRVLADFTAAGKDAGLASIAADIDQLLMDTRTGLVADGLEDAGTVQAWEQAYQHYVPLQRDIKSSGTPKGQGISVRGPESKRAVGSDKEVVNILANVVAQAETAAIRAEKAIVGRALLDMARRYPNPGFWKVDAAPTKPRIDKETGLVIRNAIDPMFQTADNVVMVKDYGLEHFIVFEKNSERAMAVAKAMKNLEIAPMNKILEVASKGTRFIASLLTQRNPLFWMTNFARDIQGAMINLQGTDAEGLQDKVLANLPKAFKGMHALVRGNGTGQWARYAREIQEAGGITGYMQQFENSDARMDDLKKIVAQMQQGKADPRRLARMTLEFVDDYNDIIENAVRLSVFQAARDNGVATAKAASIAKNITVNFNRKGNLSPPINALYMFFNASVQGTARLAQALATSRSAQVVVGSIAVMGFLLDAMNRAMSDDDEETGRNRYDMIPEFEKSKNWIFMNPMRPGEYVKVPLPLGPHVFHNAGRLIADAVFREDARNAAEYGWSMASTVLDAFSPLGATPSLGQLIAPSMLDPAMQLAENKSFTGGPVYRSDDMGFGKTDPKPAYTRHFESTPDLWKSASRALNDMSGGDKDKPGRVNLEPDILKHVFYAMTGGPGRMLDQTTDATQAQARGDKPSVNRVPFVSRFYGENDDRQRERVYYDDRKRAMDAKTQFDHFSKIGRADLAREVAEELGDGDINKGRRLMREHTNAQSSVRKINKQIRAELQKQDNGEDRAEQLSGLKQRRVKVMGSAGRERDE